MSFTASSISTGAQCPKLYKYKYVQGYREEITGPIRIGILFHKGVEEYWLGNDLATAISSMEAMSKEDDWWESDNGKVAYARCCAYVKGYYAKYHGQDTTRDTAHNGHPTTMFIEKEFEFRLNGVNYRGKMDVLILDRKLNEITIIEHKTTSTDISIGGSYLRKLPIDIQLTIYRQAAIDLLKKRVTWDEQSGGVLIRKNPNDFVMPTIVYDVVQTTKASPRQKTKKEGGHPVKKRKDETQEEVEKRKEENLETLTEFTERIAKEYKEESEKYVRHEVMCTKDEHTIRLIELEEYVKLLQNKGFLEIRNSTACGNYGGCAFLDVCTRTGRLDDFSKIEKVEDLHQELTDKNPRWVSYNC